MQPARSYSPTVWAVCNGSTVPLNTIADIQFGADSASLECFDRERLIEAEANLPLGQTISIVLSQINELSIMQNQPDSVCLRSSGKAEIIDEMFSQFGFAMVVGVMIVIVLLFKNLLQQSLTILTALPLSIDGSAVGLFAYGTALDMFSVISIIDVNGHHNPKFYFASGLRD
ncbi:efflux RND transporter permease subunit [Avibacterium paragallinarum]|uniref:Efflux RND transporter permease subunit n=1 Tax=Avibacterium paragallinarum TaxID=728 RepID=A0ABU7QHS9_AVIPA|nr:efflux RND transporter permease subunit [Avibacterium paragallinarum]MEE3609558.1 efflux RND transporter permease subunit [Avibacterium paragallinarum]MEE3621387.1 efflux RND transporter permease subunit [Avibacterium paragallinarum]MEE3669215.1 efflux RND transporter permease subunit [Avibacterium paragallinarum]MEE3681597.1 efflux RND transporter permease subunit [Avibacterium paragallinarum]MEE4386922.1 efflux RND transporter permease subunit [Avibacterium paragallinarum]